MCVHCQTCINVSRLTYHPLCPVVQWLVRRSHYQYDNEEQAFFHRRKVWISPQQRSRLVEIRKLHAALHQNVIVRTPEETAI